MKVAIEQVFSGGLQVAGINDPYDPAKINVGKHGGQYDLGAGPTDKFIGPCPVGVANLAESALAIPSQFVHPVKITDDLFWIFGSDAATAAATRRVQLWSWVPSTNTYSFIGAITCTFPAATAHTIRGLRAVITNYSTGTVAVSGALVTGTGTNWVDINCVGSRIGFGSTDPTQITQWYEVQGAGSNSAMTLATNAGTIPAGTPYVLQDLMIVQATTNATATNGGIFVTKGLRFENFTNPATAIPAAASNDKIRATYWLKDAATVTNTVIGGCALGDYVSPTEQYIYATDGAATSLKMYRYNLRAALTPTSGAFVLTGSDIVVTGAQTVVGNISQANNGRVATLAHGPGNGVPCVYAFTTTRIIRIPLASILAGSTTFVADAMSEVPPGGTNTGVATGTFTSLDVAGSLDKLVVSGAASTGTIYVTDYYTGGQQIDRRAGALASQLPSALRDTDSPIYVHNIAANVPFVWVEDGWLFWVFSQAATTNLNALSVYPLAADLAFQADVDNRIICPSISLGATPAKLYRALVNAVENLGDDTMGVAPDMFRLQVRSSGISDNSGAWIDVPPNGDISGLGTPSTVQFAFLYRTAGVIMLPARILSLALLYETDDALPSQYQWNFGDFDQANGTFAWIQTALFGAALTTHTINIYRADTNALVLTQSSSGTTNGTFQYWHNNSWNNGLHNDAIGNRRRFVPSGSLPGGVDLYAKLTVA